MRSEPRLGLRPTHGDESALLTPIDSKRVMRDFRRSVKAILRQQYPSTGRLREKPDPSRAGRAGLAAFPGLGKRDKRRYYPLRRGPAMRNSTRIAIPALLASTARWLRSLATCLAPLLASVVVVGFLVVSGVAQLPPVPNPPDDMRDISKSLPDTFDRVQIRNAPANAQVGRKIVEKEGACLLPPLTLVHSPTVGTTALQVPEKAKNEYREACAALQYKKTDSAEKHLRKATQEYPKYSVAWVTLGQILAAQEKNDEAHSACSQGVTVEPGYVPAYLCLADLAVREKAWDEVRRLSRRALELDPGTNAIAYEYSAAANLRTNKLDDAEKSALRAVEIDKDHHEPRVYFVLAQIYEAKGDTARKRRSSAST
jgi:tetratricopeptide (TPR) repeat protein